MIVRPAFDTLKVYLSVKEKIVLEKRGSSVSFALECALLFLAVVVFSWGLQAKLVQYHANSGTASTTNSMAKLSTETRMTQTVESVKAQVPPRFPVERFHLVGFAYTPQAHHAAALSMAQPERGPSIPGQYYLHGPDRKLRPPPVLA
jgi:hypothetical protein